jgi:hypothetical protein
VIQDEYVHYFLIQFLLIKFYSENSYKNFNDRKSNKSNFPQPMLKYPLHFTEVNDLKPTKCSVRKIVHFLIFPDLRTVKIQANFNIKFSFH